MQPSMDMRKSTGVSPSLLAYLIVHFGYCITYASQKRKSPKKISAVLYTSQNRLSMQHQWSLVGGMAGTFREMDFVLQDEYLRAEKGKRWQN